VPAPAASHLPSGELTPEKPRKAKKRVDYAFRRQLNEKPSIILGCPGELTKHKQANKQQASKQKPLH